jgi:hypothetical protein
VHGNIYSIWLLLDLGPYLTSYKPQRHTNNACRLVAAAERGEWPRYMS